MVVRISLSSAVHKGRDGMKPFTCFFSCVNGNGLLKICIPSRTSSKRETGEVFLVWSHDLRFQLEKTTTEAQITLNSENLVVFFYSTKGIEIKIGLKKDPVLVLPYVTAQP